MDNIDQKIQQGIETYMRDKQFNLSKIPSHEHNGTDTIQLKQKDILPSPTYATFLVENVSETFIITGIPSTLNSVTFSGIAYDSSSSPATKKSTCEGVCFFRMCFLFTGSGTTLSLGGVTGFTLIQNFNSTYFDTSSLAKTRVITGGTHLMYTEDDTATQKASLTINSFTKGVLSITSFVDTNWIIKGILTLT